MILQTSEHGAWYDCIGHTPMSAICLSKYVMLFKCSWFLLFVTKTLNNKEIVTRQ